MAKRMKKKRSHVDLITNSKDSKIDPKKEARRKKREEERKKKQNQQKSYPQNVGEVAVSTRKSKTFSGRALIYIGIMLVIGIFVLFAVSNILSLKSQEKQAQEELIELKQQKAELESQVSKMSGPEYIEQQARDWLKMIKPGELMFVLPNEEASVPVNGAGNGETSEKNSSDNPVTDEGMKKSPGNAGSSDNSGSVGSDAEVKSVPEGNYDESEEGAEFDTSLDPAIVTGSPAGQGEDD